MGFTAVEHKNNTRNVIVKDVALIVEHISGMFSSFTFNEELKNALLKEEFKNLHFGKGYQGYSIQVDVTGKWIESPVSIPLFAVTLGFFPLREEHTYTIKVSYFKNGDLIYHSPDYKTILFRYLSFWSPLGRIMASSEDKAYRMMAKDLARMIRLDFPSVNQEQNSFQINHYSDD